MQTNNSYKISPPIKRTIISLKGSFNQNDYREIAERLKSIYWSNDDKLPPMEIIEATVHALTRSDGLSSLSNFKGIILPSFLYKSAKECYDEGANKSLKVGLQLAHRLIDLDPDHKKGTILLFKLYIRLHEWDKAKEILNKIRTKKYFEFNYLEGFLYWKKRNFPKAISSFEKALWGRHYSPEVYHGLGSCLLVLENYEAGEKYLQQAMGRLTRPNKMILDLGAKFAIKQRKFDDALQKYISPLKKLGEMLEYNHTLSTLLSAQKKFSDAFKCADIAANTIPYRFETIANKADILIELERFDEALCEIERLRNRGNIGNEKADVILGLNVKLFLKKGMWHEANTHWENIKVKNNKVHVALREEILRQKLKDPTTSPGKRIEAKEELDKISKADLNKDILFIFEDAEDGLDNI